ncbi:hypothetical protein J8F10_33710 [Gemmata sp. G18]|uniref:Uncharacterized protein n=1 Tax=Gemmata palustris TaxID=2822762 RepID=A0ABS5C2K1_9BACT|nr:hypothetical protein [Gemmata palustris]MBP3960211.1 hypothetical protein [Gemmata palustris]
MLFADDFEGWKKLAALIGLAVLVTLGFVFRDYESGAAAGERLRKNHPVLARIVGFLIVLAFVSLVVFVRSR